MHTDKKTEELEQKREFEQLQQEEIEKDKQDEILEEEIELEPIENEIERAKKRNREVVFEMALFFVLGVLLGVTIKTEAVKKITMGFSDYQITKPLQSYDVTDLKKKLDEQIIQQQAEQSAQQAQLQTQN